MGGDDPVRQVNVGDRAEDNARVLLVREDLARRWRDLTRGQDACCDLVEQRLEQVVRRLADQRDVDVATLEALRSEQPAEARADHDDRVPSADPSSPRPGTDS